MTNLNYFEAPVKKLFSRYILDGNTLNYNEYQPDAITSKNNVRIGRVWPVSDLSHFLVNDNNYFFCNSNNKINAYTNTGVLYYTTEKEYPNIENMIIGMENNIYIKYDTNKLDHLVILGNMLNLIWTIENDDFGSSITSDDNYIYVNSISNKNQIYVINPRLVNEGDYIDRIITITGFSAEYDSNEHKTIKEINRSLPKDRRFIRDNLDFTQQRNELANEYMNRKAKLAEILGTDNIVPRLVWKETPVAPTTEIPSGQILYGTQKGTVSTNPTAAIMEDRSQDLIADFVQNSIIKQGVNERIGVQDAAGVYDKVVTKIDSYLSEQRLIGIGRNVKAKLAIDDTLGNQAMIKKTIEAEAQILIRRIEKDLGVKMPQAEADKLVRMKFKELMEKCQ